MNVLFVDDNRESADSLAALVTQMGHAASVAYDGPSAIERAQRDHFDLILLDIRLGEVDGRDVCSEIRRTGSSRHSQILAMTGHVGLEQGVSLGEFNGYVTKPLEFDRLEELLTS